MTLAEIIENMPGWAKITGISGILGLVLIFIFLIFVSNQPGGQEVVNIPSNLSNIKENVTDTLKDTAINTSTNIAGKIVTQFNDAGKDLAKDVKDPVAKKGIEANMTLAGVMLALFVVLIILSAFWKVIQAVMDALPF